MEEGIGFRKHKLYIVTVAVFLFRFKAFPNYAVYLSLLTFFNFKSAILPGIESFTVEIW